MSWQAVQYARQIRLGSSCDEKNTLAASEKLILFLLAENLNAKTGECRPSLTTLADDSGLSRNGVIAALRHLTERGLIATTVRHVTGGLRASNQYTIAGLSSWLAAGRPALGIRPFNGEVAAPLFNEGDGSIVTVLHHDGEATAPPMVKLLHHDGEATAPPIEPRREPRSKNREEKRVARARPPKAETPIAKPATANGPIGEVLGAIRRHVNPVPFEPLVIKQTIRPLLDAGYPPGDIAGCWEAIYATKGEPFHSELVTQHIKAWCTANRPDTWAAVTGRNGANGYVPFVKRLDGASGALGPNRTDADTERVFGGTQRFLEERRQRREATLSSDDAGPDALHLRGLGLVSGG